MSEELDLEEQRLLRRKKKYSEAGNLLQLADTCGKLGEYYNSRGEYRKALNEFKLVAKAYFKQKMSMELGRANRLIGEMFMLLEQFDKALQYEKVYLEVAQQEENQVELQRAHVTIGRTYLLKGQSCDTPENAKEPLEEAEKAFQKGLTLCKTLKEVGKIEQLDMEARALLNLGVTKEYQGRLDEAIEFMQRATKIAQNNDLAELLHQCYTSSALLYNTKKNDQAKALKILNEALEVASRLHNKASKMCETCLIKADVLIRTGDFQSARQALKKAYKLKTPVVADAENIERQLKVLVAICRAEDELITTGSNEYGKKKALFERMGDGACSLENYSRGIEYYLKMLECAQENGETERALIPIYVSLYQTYKDARQYDNALEYLWKEFKLIESIPKEAFNTLLSIAEVYEAQNKSVFDVEDIYRKARQQAQKIKSVQLERISIKRCIAMLKKYGMDLMADNYEQQAKDAGIDLAIEDNEEESEHSDVDELDETEYEVHTMDIGDDVNLSDLSDSEDENRRGSRQLDKSGEARASRRRGVPFQVKRNTKGETQLHSACISGNQVLVLKLIDQGHPVNARDNAGWLPLHEACIHGHKEVVEILLDRGAHINDRGGNSCEGVTPLYDACSNGNLDVVEYLLDRGANCTLRTDSGDTTLNIMECWFKTVQKKLLPENILFYNQIRDRMKECFDKAGIRPDGSAPIPEAIESGSTSRSTRSRANRLAQSDSDTDVVETKTTSNRSSGYGSIRDVAASSSRKRPSDTRSDSSALSSSDSEPELELARRNQFFRNKQSGEPAAGGVKDYQNAMQVLRKGSTVRAQIVSPLKDPNPEPSKRPAYMRQDEVGDDWLVDDLGPAKKRQKFLTSQDYIEGSKTINRTSRGSLERTPLKTPPNASRPPSSAEKVDLTSSSGKKRPSIADCYSDSSSEDETTDATKILMDASGKSFVRKPGAGAQVKLRWRNSSGSLKNQSSLLDAGFSSRSNSPIYNLMDRGDSPSPSKLGSASAARQLTPEKTRPESPTSTDGKSTPVKVLPPSVVRVLVDGEQIDVGYDEGRVMELNVEWLVNEVRKRYGVKHGKKPMLKLLRQDGGLCEDTDPLTALLDETDCVIQSYVSEYQEITADQFYEDYCKHKDVEVITGLMQELAVMENRETFTLPRDFFLGKTRQFEILFKAFACRGRIRILHLAFNLLNDGEFEELVKQLPSLGSLQRLDLSMNLISFKGITALSSILTEGPDGILDSPSALTQLTELDLSRNPLMDQSLPILSTVCQQLKHLKILRLASTGITSLAFVKPPLDISCFEELDVSENNLNKKSTEFLLEKMDTRIVTELNLRHLGKLREFTTLFTLKIQSHDFDMLRVLNISNCGLTDEQFSAILFPLHSNAEKLKHLDASFNPRLTHRSFTELFSCFTNHSLETVRFVQNALMLKSLNPDMMNIIGFDRQKRYPRKIELTVPLRLDEQERQELAGKLRDFWGQIWTTGSASVELQGMCVKLDSNY